MIIELAEFLGVVEYDTNLPMFLLDYRWDVSFL